MAGALVALCDTKAPIPMSRSPSSPLSSMESSRPSSCEKPGWTGPPSSAGRLRDACTRSTGASMQLDIRAFRPRVAGWQPCWPREWVPFSAIAAQRRPGASFPINPTHRSTSLYRAMPARRPGAASACIVAPPSTRPPLRATEEFPSRLLLAQLPTSARSRLRPKGAALAAKPRCLAFGSTCGIKAKRRAASSSTSSSSSAGNTDCRLRR